MEIIYGEIYIYILHHPQQSQMPTLGIGRLLYPFPWGDIKEAVQYATNDDTAPILKLQYRTVPI